MPVKYSSMAALITSDLLRPRLLATLSSLVKVSSSSLNVIIRITSPQRDGGASVMWFQISLLLRERSVKLIKWSRGRDSNPRKSGFPHHCSPPP